MRRGLLAADHGVLALCAGSADADEHRHYPQPVPLRRGSWACPHARLPRMAARENAVIGRNRVLCWLWGWIYRTDRAA